MNLGFISLGCAKNQVDSEVMQGLLSQSGFVLVADEALADVLVVNTCGFIQAAKEESIDVILAAAEHKKRNCRALVVTGCLSQRYAQDLLQEIPEIDGMIGTNHYHCIVDVVRDALQGKRTVLVGEAGYTYDEPTPRIVTLPYSAFVKIADGCDNRCSYCAIPIVRGGFRSRKMESIIHEVESLATQGVKEINLIAQDTTRYGADIYGSLALPELLRRLLSIPGPRWFRLLYCYPAHFSADLVDIIAREERIVNYVDLPLQHINQRILTQMKRKGTPAEIKELLFKLRSTIPDVVLRTTFIVGFPGESEEDFEELCSFVKETEFDHVGVFKYSQEEDTVASELEGQVPESVKEHRLDVLMSLQREISLGRNQKYLGKTIEVLVEEQWPDGNGVLGRAAKDAPEVDGVVYVKDSPCLPGQFTRVRIDDVLEYDLIGVGLNDPC